VSSSRTQLTAWVGILASVLAVVLVLAGPWRWSALAGALVLACVPSGAAVMCWIDSGDDTAQAGLTLVVSLAVFALASAIMIWAAYWHPKALLALAAASTISCVLRL
jgi:hypothetical protein